MSARATPTLADRLAVAGRVLLAALGGYGVAALATGLLAVTLPGPRAEAVSAATLASFAIMAAVGIWVFAARTLAVAALVVTVLAALLAAALWAAGGLTGGAVA
ncbi:MAG: iron transporter [Actinomycetospora chiangmaiensis]|jgi:hypothetical protein|nr:iron transporter [Actinomycetospora chiangmaiensis]